MLDVSKLVKIGVVSKEDSKTILPLVDVAHRFYSNLLDLKEVGYIIGDPFPDLKDKLQYRNFDYRVDPIVGKSFTMSFLGSCTTTSIVRSVMHRNLFVTSNSVYFIWDKSTDRNYAIDGIIA